jgi:hypothetical protein
MSLPAKGLPLLPAKLPVKDDQCSENAVKDDQCSENAVKMQ